LQELAERVGDNLSDLDDSDHRKRLIMKVDQEMAEDLANNANADNTLDDLQKSIDVDNIPDRDIIKEEDRGTDMGGFDLFLELQFGPKWAQAETQTDKVFRKHMKIGVTPSKLGNLKDKETFIDPRMFQGEGAK
jgi:hypothetical protein